MRAALRNAKIAMAKARRPWSWVDVWDRYRNFVVGRCRKHHQGDGPLRLCVGEAQVAPPPRIIPKYELRRRRQRAQRLAEAAG